MNIVAINGSHRGEAGCTQWLLDKIAEGVREVGGQFDTVVLAIQTVLPCTGCDTCHSPDSYGHCIHENMDDVKAIFEKMKAADVLVYASPVYIFTISSSMKTFLERFNSTAGIGELGLTKSGLFFGPVDKAIYSKPTVILTCCGNIEQETVKNVISYFETFSKFLDAPVVGTLARKTIGTFDHIRQGKEEPSPIVKQVIDAYIQAGRELVLQGRIASKTQKKANQQILGVPFLDFLMNFRLFKQMAIKKGK